MDPVVPDPERILEAEIRRGNPNRPEAVEDPSKISNGLGKNYSRALREADRIPAVLCGDRLPFVHVHVGRAELDTIVRRVHFQRELLTLRVEGGETVKVLPQEFQYEDRLHYKAKHITFRRWPRDPVANPVKLRVPIVFINESFVPAVKNCAYIHDMWVEGGLPCLVRDPQHIPRFIIADMKRHIDGELRFNQLDMPPGVTVVNTPMTRLNDGNFLVGRAKRIRG